ncbi:MAG: hypothetical protein ACK559_35730, partial [bacterium]
LRAVRPRRLGGGRALGLAPLALAPARLLDRLLEREPGVHLAQQVARRVAVRLAQQRLELDHREVEAVVLGEPPRERHAPSVLLGQDRRADAPVAGLEVELEHHAVDLLARQRALDAVDAELHLVERVLEDLAADDGAVAQLDDA